MGTQPSTTDFLFDIDTQMHDNRVSEFLNTHFEILRKKNRRISVRSFSKKTGIPAGRMSELLRGKRLLSDYYAQKIAQTLNLDPSQKQELYSLVSVQSRKAMEERELLEYEIAMLSSWEHYAILNLANTKDFQSKAEWIANRLALPKSKVLESLNILEKLGFIVYKNGQIKRSDERLTTTMDIPSIAIRRSLRADIEKGLDALANVPPAHRDFSSVTMAIDPKKIPKAKELTEKYRQKMSRLLENGDCTEVYNLSIQLFPMTLIEKETP